jgi:hypothetical protein
MTFSKSRIAVAVSSLLCGNIVLSANYASALKVYIAGSTSVDNTLEGLAISNVGGVCDTTQPIDIYRAANQRVILCTTRSTIVGASSLDVAIHKESTGGSSHTSYALPIAIGGLSWLNVAALSNANCAVTAVPPTTNLAGYINHASCSLQPVSNPNAMPTGGLSDTEPALWFPSSTFPPPAPDYDVVLGVAVTKSLYRALQIAQFGDSTPCDTNPAVGAYNISDTNQACVPSLHSRQIRSLYTQSYTDWDSIIRRADGTPLSQIPGVTPPALFAGVPDTAVRICRRVAASGTQAGAEAFWLGQRCVGTPVVFATPSDNSTVTDTTNVPADFVNGLVNAAVSSGDMRTCLQAAQNGNYWGVGVLSTEVTAGNLAGAGDSFRFVAVDGYAPTLSNVANGNYEFFMSGFIHASSPSTGSYLFNNDGRSTEAAVVFNALRGTTLVLANVNATFAGRPWGNGGVLKPQGTPTGKLPPYSDADMANSPVNTLTKNGNNCLHPWAGAATPTMYNPPLTPAAP